MPPKFYTWSNELIEFNFRKVSHKLMLLVVGFLLAFGLSGLLSALFPNAVRVEPDLWFGADVTRVIHNMVDPSASFGRTSVHPLFSLLMLPLTRPIFWLATSIGFESELAMGIAAQLITSISAGVTWILVFMISIQMGLNRFQSFAVSLLFLSSSAFVFWWSTPETFPLGATTILLPFFFLGLREKSHTIWLMTLVSSASITITNFIAGFISAYAVYGLRRVFFVLCSFSLVLTLIFSVVQKSYLPSANVFPNMQHEKKFINTNYFPMNAIYDFFVTPIVAPFTPVLLNNATQLNSYRRTLKLDKNGNPTLQLHFKSPSMINISPLRFGAGLVWIVFLANGIYMGLFSQRNITCTALTVFLVFQFFLHLFYGDSPFLYSAHYAPVMTLLAGYGLAVANKLNSSLSISLFSLFVGSIFFLNIDILFKSFGIGLFYVSSLG
jgi:hypothetical protein